MNSGTLAAAIAILPVSLVAVAMGSVFSKAIESVGRNPEAGDSIRKLAILGFSGVESLGLMAFVIAIMCYNK